MTGPRRRQPTRGKRGIRIVRTTRTPPGWRVPSSSAIPLSAMAPFVAGSDAPSTEERTGCRSLRPGSTSRGYPESQASNEDKILMATADEALLRKLAQSEEIEIETRHDLKCPLHRTTIWIVPTERGVYVRSGSKSGRWYREALANRNVTIRAGRRKVAASVQQVRSRSVIRAVNAAYRQKYGQTWPDSAKAVVRSARLNTTLRLIPN